MMSRIFSFAALALASMAVDSGEDETASAVQEAQKAVKAFETKMAEFRRKSGDDKDVQAMANKFLQLAGNRSTVLGSLHAAEKQQNKEMRALRSDAKKAARTIKVSARKAAHASKQAGMPEAVYEVVEQRAEGLSESMQDSADKLGDQAEDYVENFFQKVEREVERQLDMKALEAEQKKERQEQRKEKAQQREDEDAQQKDQTPKEQKTPVAPKEQQKPDEAVQASSQQKAPPAQALATITPADLSSFACAAVFGSALTMFGLALRTRFQRAEPSGSAYEPLAA